MKICLFAEGCYPYVVGGVSSWIQTFIEQMTDFEFALYTIAVDEGQRGQFKYHLPPNITEVYENFFWGGDTVNTGKLRKRKKVLPPDEAKILHAIVLTETDVDWVAAYHLLRRDDFDYNAYLNGYDFLDAAKERYARDEVKCVFSDYLWTLRSMFIPLFTILSKELPVADVYHSVSAGYAGVMAAIASLVYDKPFVLSEHGIYTREREEELIRSKWTQGYLKDMWIQQFYMLSRLAYDRAEVVTSLFHKNADIQAELGCDPSKIRVIHNAVSHALVGKPPPEASDGIIKVGAVIRVTPIKDIKTMILAFHQVERMMPNTRFYIMGPTDEDEEYYNECVALLEQTGAKNIEMTGRIRIQDYVPSMDIMVLTSISEAQPLSVLESMINRKPCVCTNVGCCSELLMGAPGDTEGQAGFIAPIMDVQEIARCICRLADNRELRIQMGENGYRRVTKYYRMDAMFTEYREVYHGVGK